MTRLSFLLGLALLAGSAQAQQRFGPLEKRLDLSDLHDPAAARVHLGLSGGIAASGDISAADVSAALGYTPASTAGSTPPGGSSGQVQINLSGAFAGLTIGGDATLNSSTGALTVTKTNGVSFAPSATSDTTNAANITSGTLPAARLPTFSNSVAGAVPASGGGTADYLRADGSWAAPPSGGGTPGGSSGQVQINLSGAFAGLTIGGDATLNSSTGALTVTKTGGVAFAPSATSDTTNAANIISGTLPAARLPTFSNSVAGAVPASGGGTTNFLRADGVFAAPSGGSGGAGCPIPSGGSYQSGRDYMEFQALANNGATIGANQAVAQPWEACAQGTLQSVIFYIGTGPTSTTQVIVEVCPDAGGGPGTPCNASATTSIAAATTGAEVIAVSPLTVSAGTLYWIVLFADTAGMKVTANVNGGGGFAAFSNPMLSMHVGAATAATLFVNSTGGSVWTSGTWPTVPTSGWITSTASPRRLPPLGRASNANFTHIMS